MQWEELSAGDFRTAAEQTGVCVVAMGVIEEHGDHLPLGTDFLNAHRIACLAAAKEAAVVFPPFYFGQIYEGRCFPGTVAIKPGLLLELVLGVLDEIGRNGFAKIVLYNGHGGNIDLVRFVAQCGLSEEKPYCVYAPDLLFLTPERRKHWDETCDADAICHGCEYETSLSLANHPDLVRMDRVPASGVAPLGRLKHLPPTFTAIRWYADYPGHYGGDARPATREKGAILRDLLVDSLADYLAAVKQDDVVPSLTAEFHAQARGEGVDP